MSDYLHMPLALTYLAVAIGINAGPRPADRDLLWASSVLAAAEAAVTIDLDRWAAAAVWILLFGLHCEELGRAYRPSLYHEVGPCRA
ncbi:hypothetical protein [Micromonospora sp. NPDC047730]|uniref:hypothetical protein n=1 Tax=Micromonospora sp. NPDC047730 TaxID=3364253 RepID=UPI0037221D74